MTNVSELRLAMRAAGFDPIPVSGKHPLIDGWQTKAGASVKEIASWGGTGTGMLTGRTPTLDLDIMDPEAASATEEMVRDWFDGRGPILVRFGLAPKRAIPFRTSTPFPKMVANFVAPDGNKHKIEILGAGQQVVVDGTHPDTGKPYTWHGGRPGTVAWADLPEITEQEAAEFLELAAAMLGERFGFKQIEERTNGHADPFAAHGAQFKAPLNVEAELDTLIREGTGGGSVNDALPRVIASMLRHAVPPHTVRDVVTDAAMAMATRLKLDWTREKELRFTNRRINSAYRNLLLKEYDYRTGEIPAWLPEEFHARWAEILTEGRRPDIGLNPGGFYVRSWAVNGEGEQPKSPKDEVPKPGKTEGPKFKLLKFRDLRPGMEDQDYLIDELLPMEGLVVVWGKFKCLKTFLVYDICFHVAKGWEYRDRQVRQGTVVYCAFEGAHGFRKRTEAIRRHYKLPDDDDVPIYLMPCQTNLIKDHARLIADVGRQLEPGERAAIVVLDTLNRSLVGSEGKDVDMAAYIAAASAVREAFKCLVIVVHHCGWDESRPRGHSSLPGAVDGQLAVTREGERATMLVEFLRDGPEGAEIHSMVKVVVVAEDASGKESTSLVVCPSDSPAQGTGTRSWPSSLAVLRRALKAALAARGESFRENVLSMPVQAVDLEAVRTEYYAIFPAKGDTPAQRQDNKKHGFQRSLAKAQEKDLIRIRELPKMPPMVWFAPADTTWQGADE